METVFRPATGEASGLPFTGLGHNIDPVCTRAALLELAPVHTNDVLHPDVHGVLPVHPEKLPAVAGFGLLVTLGREIRGR